MISQYRLQPHALQKEYQKEEANGKDDLISSDSNADFGHDASVGCQNVVFMFVKVTSRKFSKESEKCVVGNLSYCWRIIGYRTNCQETE